MKRRDFIVFFSVSWFVSCLSVATRYQNAAIDYYMGLTGSSYLHYGYWEPLPRSGEELTLTRLRMAQSAYAAKLLSFIPEGIKTVLGVGCGIGGNAAYLCDRGFIVEGLAPDTLQQEKFIKNTNSQVPFYLTRFSDSVKLIILIAQIAMGASYFLFFQQE
jgi:MPBQ/MSBQ methyltransferase